MAVLNRVVLAAVLLGAGSGAGSAEGIDFERFFSGRLTGSGAVDNRRDGTHRAFTATLNGSWTGPRGSLTEDLTYADGEKKRFAWTFERTAEGRWSGRRDDLVGVAAVAKDGDALRMTYSARTRLPSGAVWTLSFDDRFRQIDADTVTMTGAVSYLFLGVGTTQMTISKNSR